MKSWCLLLFSAISLFSEDFTLRVEGIEDEILVSVPKNHEPGKTWPAVFYYHGTGGRPTTSLIRRHTGENDWIVVGMSYLQRGTFQLKPETMVAEVAVLEKVKKELQERVNLDPARVYVSGFSKGGWMAGLFLQSVPSLAGGAILGAGHKDQLVSEPLPLEDGTPIFVGVGRHDPNYPFGLKALIFFRGLKGQVEMEAWPGLGHSFPREGSTGLREWFDMRLGREPKKEGLEKELAEILSKKDEFKRWWSLIEFYERPFVKALPEFAEQVKQARMKQEVKSPRLAREARILKESRRLLTGEIGLKTLESLEEIVAGYARIVEAAGESPQGRVAEKDHARASEILVYARKEYGKQASEQEKKNNDPFKNKTGIERRGFRNPLVR